jgi:hypothetical protein
MTKTLQGFTKRYVSIAVVLLIGLVVVSSILLHSGCGMTSPPRIPTPTPTPAPDTTAPTVTSFSPAAGATNVDSFNPIVTVTFSEVMDERTITFSTIEILDPSGDRRGGALTYNPGSSTATLVPIDGLDEGVTYTVRVRGGAVDPRVKDVAGNALAADVTWTFTTALPPLKVFATTPSDTSTGSSTGVAPIAFFNKPLKPETVNDTTVLLTDAAGAPVHFNLFYDATNWTVRLVPTTLLQPDQKYTVTLKGGSASARIIDTDGLSLAADVVFSFTTAAAPPQIPVSSIFVPPNDIPDDPIFEEDDAAVELGLKFRSDVDGLITGLRFYKGGAANGGPHIGHLWTSTGTLLGSVTFSNETASGWQQAFFLTPIQITANTAYVVSYFAPQGNYAVSTGQFGLPIDTPPLHALSNSEAGGNGVFFYGPQGGFPNGNSNGLNYWVDVIFTDRQAAPQVLSVNPAPGAAGVSTGVAPTASFSEPLDPMTVTLDNVQMFDTGNNPVPVTVSYEPSSFTVTVTPQAPLLHSSAYIVFLRSGPDGITDSTGIPLANVYTWAFSTALTRPVPTFSIFAPASTPVNPIDPDAQAIEVGLKFRSNTNGIITGVRFYKGDTTNGGTHVGRLWTSAGMLLGSVRFTNETDSGWQEAIFPTPISVTANTVYVVSYFSPQGHYANDHNSFDPDGVNSDPLFALSNSEASGDPFGNGVYLISPQGGFPVFSNFASNYWVDVIFVPVQP